MAGNVTAFNTVWTYDIYQGYINPGKSDKHYLVMGQMATIFGVIISIGAAYVAKMFNNVMDFLQLIFAFINAPLFATFLLGMFWKRATGNGAFFGLLTGTLAAALHHGLDIPDRCRITCQGRMAWNSRLSLPQRNGPEFLDSHLFLDELLCHDHYHFSPYKTHEIG